ncbi:efflux RND transporter periplasmic adaptor subunit [Paenibacillus sp. NPDC058071]|uniref:efflux RND transporter periplasmic adaptor subunit n=1 Tax=Paenibacillus sp. NPDC058071 TaxID=3346326 RepID=UPI0036DF69D6
MKRWSIWIGVILIVAAAGAGAYYYFLQDKETTAAAPSAMTVKATKGSIEVKVSGTGTVEANERASVTAGVSGTVKSLGFKEGDTVKKGQVLVTFENADMSSQIGKLDITLKKQQLQMEQYQTQYKEAIGTEDEEQRKKSITNDIEMLKLEIAQNESDRKDLVAQQSEVKQVIAPVGGQVTTSTIAVGDELQPNAAVAEIVNYKALKFVIQVDELDMPKMKVGQAVQVNLNAIADRTIEGTVEELAKEGTASNGVAAYEVTIGLKDIEGVIAGMSGQADIVIESKEDIVVVPASAVLEMRGKSYVRVPSAGSSSASGGNGEQRPGLEGGGGQFPSGEAFNGPNGVPPEGGFGGAEGERPERQPNAAADGQSTRQPNAAADGQSTRQPNAAAGGQSTRQQNPAVGGAQSSRQPGAAMGGQLKEVTAGISDENYVEIVSGLSEGDEVLVALPQGTVGSSSQSSQQQMPGMFFGGGAGGSGGGFPGGGGFQGGGMTRTGGAGGFGGGGR